MLDRRSFLRRGAFALGGALVLPGGLVGLNGAHRVYASNGEGGYGPLGPKADLRDGVARLALPDGFQYRSFGVAGTPMSDGNLTPLAHDGMTAFRLPSGNVRLIRNHEDGNAPGAGSVQGSPATKYDALGGGGTTSLEIDPITRELVRDFISLNGTIVNCAGGRTPGGVWLTCEETTAGLTRGWEQPHGYVFAVQALAETTVPAIPLRAMGRFRHEAVAVDPSSGAAYETEDNGGNSGFYRFLPVGSKLQMLAVEASPNYDARTGQIVGEPLSVTWVDIADPDPFEAELNSSAVFRQGYAAGGARFNRLEGAWCGSGRIYFVSTNGGDGGLGQVWEYTPLGPSGGRLVLLYESLVATALDGPDNMTMSPNGRILICEDRGGEQYLRGLTPDGKVFDFALNLSNDSEWAGAAFLTGELRVRHEGQAARGRDSSPGRSGQTLFVNRQGALAGSNPPSPGAEGMTFAIWGPWELGAL